MRPDIEERLPAITPQLALRVAILGGVALVAFSIIFFRLWFLQVLTGEEYVSQAADNRVRKITIEAPRGDIVDRNDQPLVRTREAPVVQIRPSALPESEREAAARYSRERSQAELRRLEAEKRLRELDQRRRAARRDAPAARNRAERRALARTRRSDRRDRRKLVRASRHADPVAIPPLPDDPALRRVYRRLSRVLDVSVGRIHERVVEGIAEAPYANVTIKTDVPMAAYNYLVERRERFPGVEPTSIYLRDYPEDEIGAHIFGTVREISPDEQKLKRYEGLEQGTLIGRDGVEETYDEYLRGTPGFDRVVIDAFGERDERREVSRRDPRQGHRVRLTMDLDLQEAAHEALEQAIAAAASKGAQAGAYVAMNPEDGEIYALGSYPSFDANVFARPISQDTYDELRSEANGAPLFNRAIGSGYPTGSTFKPVTALAALEEGILTPGQIINDRGYFNLGDRRLKNARDAVFGPIELTRALKVSSDVFFYTLGARANARGPIIQDWARKLGFGRSTGIDLPGEAKGLVPDRDWRDTGYRRYSRCVKREKVPARTTAALLACGGIERPWSLGDNVNLAIGQGDFQATPLQLAVGYSAIVNDGGKVVRPHLGKTVEDGAGRIVEELDHPPRRRVDFAPEHRRAIMEGLRKAAMEEGGTSYGVFEGFARGRLQVHGKTGTVERLGQPDQAWYAAYVPHPTRPIVVVVTIEKGGFGSDTAAPAARLILSEWFDLGEEKFRGGVVTE
jgi:penicillin-binding protein 2